MRHCKFLQINCLHSSHESCCNSRKGAPWHSKEHLLLELCAAFERVNTCQPATENCWNAVCSTESVSYCSTLRRPASSVPIYHSTRVQSGNTTWNQSYPLHGAKILKMMYQYTPSCKQNNYIKIKWYCESFLEFPVGHEFLHQGAQIHQLYRLVPRWASTWRFKQTNSSGIASLPVWLSQLPACYVRDATFATHSGPVNQKVTKNQPALICQHQAFQCISVDKTTCNFRNFSLFVATASEFLTSEVLQLQRVLNELNSFQPWHIFHRLSNIHSNNLEEPLRKLRDVLQSFRCGFILVKRGIAADTPMALRWDVRCSWVLIESYLYICCWTAAVFPHTIIAT